MDNVVNDCNSFHFSFKLNMRIRITNQFYLFHFFSILPNSIQFNHNKRSIQATSEEGMRERGERNCVDVTYREQLVKEEEITWDEEVDEDQMTLSQLFRSRETPTHSSPMVKLEMPLATKKRQAVRRKGKGVSNTKLNDCKRKYDHFEAPSASVMERAKETQSNLSPKFPSFIKLMLRSHVTKGFWLGLPSEFCKLHLPRQDSTIILEGESEEGYKTNFLAEKVGLSGGWKGFSVAHKLLEGDVLVFHLIWPCKFKVYIVRANDLDEVDGALGLLNLDTCCTIETDVACEENNIRSSKKTKKKVCILKKTQMVTNSRIGPVTDQSEEGGKDTVSEEPDLLKENFEKGFQFSGSACDFEKFNIIVNGLIIDSELSKHLRNKYYELCCTQKSYLHNRLLKNINCKLAAGIISETVNIADAIRASKLSTSLAEFTIWDKTLEAFDQLGMDVGFLRARLIRLLNLSRESNEGEESKRYEEARLARERAVEEISTLESRLLILKEVKIGLDEDIEVLDINAQRYKNMFQEEVNAPW